MKLTRTSTALLGVAAMVLAAVPAAAASTSASTQHDGHAARAKARASTLPGGYKHLVVIYEENHSFDNLYGRWGRVAGHRVIGLRSAPRSTKKQVTQEGKPYKCLMQNDPSLTSPPLSSRCHEPAPHEFDSHFRNKPFLIDRYIKPTDKTCPVPGSTTGALTKGGCTRDLVHRFYQEQYQLDGGKQDRYVTGSDAVGLTMGTYATKRLPVYRYLHSRGAPHYVIADRFFQAAFGGSFLNHQWLIAARSPVDTSAAPGGAHAGLHSVVDANGFPNATYPLYKPATPVNDAQLTQACGAAANPAVACGDYAVNTIQPGSPPQGSGPQLPLVDDATYPNIGDRLTQAGISWRWYSGGWDDAAAGHPGPLFQFHHQPFVYFKNYAPGTPGRSHLKDEKNFFTAVRRGNLPRVSFVKPYGAENEHPGYTDEHSGSSHLVKLLKSIDRSPEAKSTLVVVTYDEFGGQWDHVPPPGQSGATPGVHDEWGPGTRIPALVLSKSLRRSGVDHTVYDTTSILATIERSFELAPLSTRDGAVHDLRHAVAVGGR